MSQKVIVIGAGIGGIATASLLTQAGYEVHVYEKAAKAGGRAGQYKQNGFTFDTGPSWYLMPSVFERFYSLLGEQLSDHVQLQRLSPAYKVFFEQQPTVTITSDIAKDAATFDAIEPGAGEALKRYVQQSNEIYQLSLRHFLYNAFARPKDLFRKDILRNGFRMVRLAYTPINRYVASFVTDQRLRQILEYPMVFLGTSPFTAPAIYSLMSALDFKEGVFYPEGGIYTIIESMQKIAQKRGVVFHFDSAVEQILVHDGVAAGVQLADGSRQFADYVVSNADLHFTETKMLPISSQSYPESYWQRKEASPSAILLYLGVEGKLPQFEHHNLLFVDAWRENFTAMYDTHEYPKKASLYICVPSRTDETVAPPEDENVFVLIPVPSGKTPDQQTQDALVERYLQQIYDMTGVDLRDRLLSKTVFGPEDFRTQYHAWQASMLGQSHKLYQSAFFRTPNYSKKVKNVWYVGANTRPGIGLPMCLISAELVAEGIVGQPMQPHESEAQQ